MVEDRILLEEDKRRFMVGRKVEIERESGPVTIDHFSDEEFYKPEYGGSRISYRYK